MPFSFFFQTLNNILHISLEKIMIMIFHGVKEKKSEAKRKGKRRRKKSLFVALGDMILMIKKVDRFCHPFTKVAFLLFWHRFFDSFSLKKKRERERGRNHNNNTKTTKTSLWFG